MESLEVSLREALTRGLPGLPRTRPAESRRLSLPLFVGTGEAADSLLDSRPFDCGFGESFLDSLLLDDNTGEESLRDSRPLSEGAGEEVESLRDSRPFVEGTGDAVESRRDLGSGTGEVLLSRDGAGELGLDSGERTGGGGL